MSRLEARVEKLEALPSAGDNTPIAVVRYNPGDTRSWLPDMMARLGWPATLQALVTIDASCPDGAEPEVIVPPLPYSRMSLEQSAIVAHAGMRAGPWWIAVTGRGWSEAVPMTDGEPALLAQLRAERRRDQMGWRGDL